MEPRATRRAGQPGARPAAGDHLLERSQWLPVSLPRTFAFFADPANLEAITPGFLGFRILTPLPVAMGAGTLIAYRLRLMGIPFDWLTRIEEWAPERSFTDVQLRGPYARWVHTHTFTAERGGTRVDDRVVYALPGAPWTAPVHRLFVRPALARIFAHRRARIAELLR